jgi:PAS domain S-box-containing protein
MELERTIRRLGKAAFIGDKQAVPYWRERDWMTTKLMTKETPKLLAIGKGSSCRAAHVDLLRHAGFDIDQAETTREALDQLNGHNYGLALIDCPALDADAHDICQHLRKSYPDISILVTAAAPLETKAASGFETLADGLLFEPVAPTELVTCVRTLLRLHQLQASSSGGTALSASNREARDQAHTDYLAAHVAALYASSIDAIVSIDENDVITSWSTVAEKLSGYRANESIGKKLEDMDGTQDALTQRHQYLQHLHDGEPIEYQAVRTRKDGEQIEVWVRGAPIKLKNGENIGATFFVRDITAQKRREQHVHFLMRELTHRSKNLLAVIQAMARQSLSHLNSPEEFVTRFSARLSGLAGSHDLLSNVDWEGASLVDLIRSQLRHYEDRFDEKIHISGPDLFLRPEAAQNIGIALHELSTNAAKYGALSVADGSVSISWDMRTEKDIPRLHMTWLEKGGPSVNPPSRKGFGHVVMDRITGQALGGTSHAEFNPEGLSWTLDVPAASVVLEKSAKPA